MYNTSEFYMVIFNIQFLHEIGRLFFEFNLIAFFAIALGLILILVDLDQATDRRLSIIGLSMLSLGIIFRIIDNGNAFMAFVLVLLVSIIIIVFYLTMTVKSKRAWFFKATTLSINIELSDTKVSYDFLTGQEGIAIAEINPQGHVCINEINFFVTSVDARPILKGKTIVVTSVESQSIYVKEMIPEDII